MAVTPQTLRAIKGQPLSTVIESTGAILKKVGREFLTQCLWHDDANPSLTINDDKCFCYCHVCGSGGDAIDYLSQRLGLSWREAAEKAAEILGVQFAVDDENPVESARRREERRRQIAKLEADQATFKANIRDQKAGRIRQILLDRGLTREAAAEFGIGFSASGPFAGRITLPIHDHRGDLVGFTGRATKPEQDSKYKNSSDSELFQKKQLVFNEVRAKEAARESGSLVFVEGHLDVVSMWQAGIRNVVALQGTGAPDMTILKRLVRVTKKLILCFDGDAGGKKATEQFLSVAGPMALAGEVSITVASLPQGQDPDEVIRAGGNLYNYLASAPSWLDWIIDVWAAGLDREDTASITNVEKKLRALIDGMQSKALRAHYIDKATRVLARSDKEASKLAKTWGNRTFFSAEAPWKPRSAPEMRLAAERRLLRLYAHRPELREALRPLLERVTNPALLWLIQRLAELEQVSSIDLTPHSVMAIISVSEPHYMEQLRTLVRPNVILDDSFGVIDHLRDVLLENDTQSETLSDDPKADFNDSN